MTESDSTGRGGGYVPGPLPPPERVAPARVLPAQHSLETWMVRIHNQGVSNSCVGQSLAAIMEITEAEHAPHQPHPWFSSGYVWNQVNGGRDAGVTFQAACSVLQRQGNSRHKLFPYDGPELVREYHQQPDGHAHADAAHYRIAAWASIANGDRLTMKAEIMAGLPLAVAAPVHDNYLYAEGTTPPVIDEPVGRLHFRHVVTAVGYTPQGLLILNSWGPGWGHQGRGILTWKYLQTMAAEIIVCKRAWIPHRADETESSGS